MLWFHSDTHYTGLNEDPRPKEAKQKDYLHEERIEPTGVGDPFRFTHITASEFPAENQKGTSSCVPHGVGLALSIARKALLGTFTRISPMYVYRQRSNFPGEGCYQQEVFELYKGGSCLYQTLPTPETEQEANAVILTQAERNEAAIYKGLKYFTFGLGVNDINEIAKIAATGKGVAIDIFATYSEWAREYPQIIARGLTRQFAEVRHDVCVLPNSGFLKDGVRYVTIQDSAWFGGVNIRHLSEDFIRTRVFNAGYWDQIDAYAGGKMPKYVFTKMLKVGSSGEEVRQLQLLLISERLLPTDCASGYFGGLTLAGVRAFQNKYSEDILKPLGVDEPTEWWGSMCISKANKLTKVL